jgi:yecA family protein
MSTERLLEALDFDLMADVFVSEGITASPAELHGQLCGYLAAGVSLREEDWLQMALEFADIEKWQEAASKAAIIELYQATLSLFQNGEYALVPCIADEDAEISLRGTTLAQWAHGFLAGYGLAGRKQETISDDARQVLQDFANISGLRADMEQMEDNNENDADLTELIEYARLSAMMLFSEHHGVVPDADLTKQRPLH